MLHTKFQASKLSSFGEDFKYIFIFEPKTPQLWLQGHFGLQAYHFNNFGRGPLDEALYHISKASAYEFKNEDF